MNITIITKILTLTGKESLEEAMKHFNDQNVLLSEKMESISKELDKFLNKDKAPTGL